MSRHVVKLGSGIVAASGGELRHGVLASICRTVATRRRQGDDVIIVTSGAIARGVSLMGLKARPTATDDLQAASAVGQGRLYRVYDELLSAEDVQTAQVLLTFFDLSERGNYLNARQTLRRLLDWGVVPIINENDTTATDELTFGDNDFLAAQVATLVEADHLVLLTSVDGVMTADPRRDPEASVIAVVDDFESLAGVADITSSTSALGSGGMRSKVVAAEMATAAGIPVTICNGLREGALDTVLSGSGGEGTRFPARQSGHSSFKLWLRYAKASRGTVKVDDGAVRALLDGGTSLLPVGVVEVSDGFRAGDAVEIVDTSGKVLGKGLVNYDAADLHKIVGMQSSQAREVLPWGAEEAVHRDYFVAV